MSDGLVILASFTVRSDGMARFLELIALNAAASVRDEPGCRRFDVTVPEDGSNDVLLYEIYNSSAAFDAHMASPHFLAFRDASKELVTAVNVRRMILHEHAKPPR